MALLAGIVTVVSTFVVAVLYPQNFINQLICGAIDLIASIFPSTPTPLKLTSIINTLASTFPIFGKVLLQNIIGTIRDLFSLYFIIKIYRLIPFKAT